MWNFFLASFVFEHQSVSDLLRELKRNRQVTFLVGLTITKAKIEKGNKKHLSYLVS